MFNMDKVSDVLGSERRKALNACVKVKIYGGPETQKYTREQALDRLRRCFEGVVSRPFLICQLESKDFFLLVKNGGTNREDIFDIFDIHDALVRCDELPYVEKYPRPGPRCDEMKKLIDGRRADIERQLKTTDNPEIKKYPRLLARRLVRDCFAGGFPRDDGVMESIALFPLVREPYSIRCIYDCICAWDIVLSRPELCTHAKSQNSKSIAKHAKETGIIYDARHKGLCSLALSLVDKDEYPFKPCEDPHCRGSYNIIDIDQAVEYLDGKKAMYNQPEDDCPDDCPVYDLKRLINKCRTEVRKEDTLYEEQRGFGGVKYSLIEVERRLRDCFPGPGPVETDVLLSENGREEEANQTYHIFEIKSAVDCLDSKRLGDLLQEGTYKTALKARAEITEEYNKASQKVEIDHGSGIIVDEHFVVTNMHVIEDVMNDASKGVTIFNAAIGECSCVVFHHDARKDLALLCSKDGLNLKAKKISPLQLCSQPLLPGMQIFAFGFPMSHTGETALFVTGHVSGSKVNYSGQTSAVLNCPLNSGNSGGPILCWVKGQLKVAGVAMQKHFKEILTLEERLKIEKIRESYQTSTILGVSDEEISARSSSSDPCQIPLNLLTLKLYNALETHSQFNLSNAVPGRDVIDFIKDTLRKYFGQH